MVEITAVLGDDQMRMMTFLMALLIATTASGQVSEGFAFGYQIGQQVGPPEFPDFDTCAVWIDAEEAIYSNQLQNASLNVSLMTGTIVAIAASQQFRRNQEAIDFSQSMGEAFTERFGNNDLDLNITVGSGWITWKRRLGDFALLVITSLIDDGLSPNASGELREYSATEVILLPYETGESPGEFGMLRIEECAERLRLENETIIQLERDELLLGLD